MIQKIDHTDIVLARKIRSIFQVSYAVEADLLKAIDFPPLNRTLVSFLKSKTEFYGYFQDDELAAVTEIRSQNNNTHIQSLVVDPFYFRQGIGAKLVDFTFTNFSTPSFSVETGSDNLPAIALYIKSGFIETKQWNTDYGIRKIRLEKRI